MIKFTGNDAWFLPNVHKSNLSNFPLNKLCEGSFTFCVRVKPDWDNMPLTAENQYTYWGGIMMRNGMHCGLVSLRRKTEISVSAEIWVNVNGVPKPITTFLTLQEKDKDKWLDLTFIYDKSTNSIKLYSNEYNHFDGASDEQKALYIKLLKQYLEKNGKNVHTPEDLSEEKRRELPKFLKDNGVTFKKEYYGVNSAKLPGQIIDYQDSWLWIGCANGFGNCEEKHRQYLHGNISHLGIFSKSLTEDEIKIFFNSCDEGFDSTDISKLNPITYTDFKKRTLYKSFDFSGNGNHIIEYNPAWGAL